MKDDPGLSAFFAPATRLMDRLRYPRKMALMAAVIALPLGVFLFLLVGQINSAVEKALGEKAGVEYSRRVAALVRDVQLHRGMASAFLGGDPSFGPGLAETEALIEKDMAAIDEISALLDAGERWPELKEKWASVLQSYRWAGAQASFEAHTEFISGALSLMTHVADVTNLTLDPDLDSFYLMDSVINKLPLAAEYLGRIRGTGVAAAMPGGLPQGERVRLIMLAGLARAAMDDVEANMLKALAVNPGADGALRASFAEADSAVKAALATLDEKVIFSSEPSAGAAEYFAALSQAMDKSYALHGAATESLEGVLAGRVEALKRKRALILGGSAAALLLALYLFGGNYLSVTRALSRLVGASEKIGRGEMGVRVPLETSDEIATVGRSFNEMASGLEKAVAELRRSNEELEHFAYAASHDLKAPLLAVASDLKLMERRLRGGEAEEAEAAELLSDALAQLEMMQAMISDLLSYSRVGTAGRPFKEVDLGQALERAKDGLRVSIEESGARVAADTPLPRIKADPVQMVMLFQNIISNAVKYRRGDAPEVRVSARREGEEWVFSIRDNGIGFPAGDRERIFELFARLHKDRYPGTGIGLATCKKIVERHGGRIWAESEPGRGSAFHFTMPAGEDPRELS
ncbi:MAG: hypothetical protein Kow0025_24290 [Thermodesulfovibrionales bacterium]